jgi:hypothetical protein
MDPTLSSYIGPAEGGLRGRFKVLLDAFSSRQKGVQSQQGLRDRFKALLDAWARWWAWEP